MKKILIIIDSFLANRLIERMIESNTDKNFYDVIYTDDAILPLQKPSNFAFFKFDPTSILKLDQIIKNSDHFEALLSLKTKEETQAVINIIRFRKKNFEITVLDEWGMELAGDPYLQKISTKDILSNRLLQKLPNIPVIANNIGLGLGEIMEIRIPFGSSFAYRYIGSIEQNEWKIAALYRNQNLVKLTPSVILKPNDIIITIGKPNILMQIYSAINVTSGQFPMPFGQNLYLFLNLYLINQQEALKCVKDAIFLHQKLKNKLLIIKITRPNDSLLLSQIRKIAQDDDTIDVQVDFKNIGFRKILENDINQYDIGMVILSHMIFEYKEAIQNILKIKIPIFKLGHERVEDIKNSVILLNEQKDYEQISPIVFDINSQLKNQIKLLNMTPEDEDRKALLDHFDNLSKIFSQNIEVKQKPNNPIKELKKEKEMLQILPFKEKMLENRLLSFFHPNSDLLSFDINTHNQLIIPVIEE